MLDRIIPVVGAVRRTTPVIEMGDPSLEKMGVVGSKKKKDTLGNCRRKEKFKGARMKLLNFLWKNVGHGKGMCFFSL